MISLTCNSFFNRGRKYSWWKKRQVLLCSIFVGFIAQNSVQRREKIRCSKSLLRVCPVQFHKCSSYQNSIQIDGLLPTATYDDLRMTWSWSWKNKQGWRQIQRSCCWWQRMLGRFLKMYVYIQRLHAIVFWYYVQSVYALSDVVIPVVHLNGH